MLESKKIHNLSSEKLLHFPNVNSLMKISIGLIFFTVLSTALVYAETDSDTTHTVNIFENAYLQDTPRYLDESLFSVDFGTFVKIVNNDVISHKFVSGSSNSFHQSNANYDDYLVCELGERIAPTVDNQQDDNICDFNKDNRIIVNELHPGQSVSVELVDVGTYRIIEPDYPWIEFVVYSFEKPQSPEPVQEKVIEEPQVIKTVNIIPPLPIQTIAVNVDDNSYDVEYTVQGMTVIGIESDTESMSLIFSVDVTDLTGILDVTFERSFFDSIYDDVDDLFFVLSDGDETISEETKTSQSRTLSIKVPSGTEELEIIGSVFNNIETPVIETPVIETPVIETPVIEENITNQCGPGTVLENDVCILDERCGPGTVLENNVCILDSTPVSSSSQSPGTSKELIISFTIAFVIAGIVGIVLALIAKAHKNKN